MEYNINIFGYQTQHFNADARSTFTFQDGLARLITTDPSESVRKSFKRMAETVDKLLVITQPEQAHSLLQHAAIENYKSGMYVNLSFLNGYLAEKMLEKGGVVKDHEKEIKVPEIIVEEIVTTPVKKITRRHINTLLREKKAFVKGLTDNQAIDEWNNNSYAIKAGLSPRWTKSFFKKNPGYYREYLVSLLVENELTEEEYKKYFAQGGNIKGGYTIKELHSKNKEELVSLYKEKYGIEASHQDYDTIAAALYFGKRIKHLTEKQEEKFKTKKAKGGIHIKSAAPTSPAAPATPYQPHVPGSKKKGGTFKTKADAIAAELLGTKVPKKYQGEYGKKYGKKSAKTAADKIAASILKKEKRK